MDDANEFENADAISVGVTFLSKDWPRERFPDRISFEDEFDAELFGDEEADDCEWLNSVGSGSGKGVINVDYETTDPGRFLVQARAALKRLQMPPSTRINISDEDGNWTDHPVYEG